MVADHRRAEHGPIALPRLAPRLGDEAGLVKELVALKHELLVPAPAVEAESDRCARPADRPVAAAFRPSGKARRDGAAIKGGRPAR